jgi:hypothetical protein
MDEPLISTGRNPVDLVLFGVGFAALLVAIAGVVVDVAYVSIQGMVLCLFVLMTFWIKGA